MGGIIVQEKGPPPFRESEIWDLGEAAKIIRVFRILLSEFFRFLLLQMIFIVRSKAPPYRSQEGTGATPRPGRGPLHQGDRVSAECGFVYLQEIVGESKFKTR